MTSIADDVVTSGNSAPRAIFGGMPTTHPTRAAMLGDPNDMLDAKGVADYLSRLRGREVRDHTVRNYRRNRVHEFPVADEEFGGRAAKPGEMLPAWPEPRPAAQNAAGQWERIRPRGRLWKRKTIYDWNASRPSTD